MKIPLFLFRFPEEMQLYLCWKILEAASSELE